MAERSDKDKGDRQTNEARAAASHKKDSASDRLHKLTPEEAAETVFPPGCEVIYPHNPNEPGNDVLEETGVVRSIFLNIGGHLAPGSSRHLMYEIKLGKGVTKTVPETDLQYATGCDVFVRNEGIIAGRKAQEKLKASVMEGNSEKSEYNLLVRVNDGALRVRKYGIAADLIRFRNPKKRKRSASPLKSSVSHKEGASLPNDDDNVKDQSASISSPSSNDDDNAKDQNRSAAGPSTDGGESTRNELKSAPPNPSASQQSGEARPPRAQSNKDSKNQIGNALLQDVPAENEKNTERHAHSAVTTTSSAASGTKARAEGSRIESRANPRDSDFVEGIIIPDWLVARNVVPYIIGYGGKQIRDLKRRYRCEVSIRGRGTRDRDEVSNDDVAHVLVWGLDQNLVQEAKTTIEKWMIDLVRGKCQASLGRLLHSLAAVDIVQGRPGKRIRTISRSIVNQSSPIESTSQVWMSVIDLPSNKNGEYHGRFLQQSQKSEVEKQSHCDTKIHGVYGEDLWCDPYAIITADEKNVVERVHLLVKNKLRKHMDSCDCKLKK